MYVQDVHLNKVIFRKYCEYWKSWKSKCKKYVYMYNKKSTN